MPKNKNTYNTLFIGEAALKEASLINDNVDMKTILPTIRLCQEKYIEPAIGTSLYADLQTKIVSGSLNTDETFLLDAYIQPVMVWGIMKESTFFMSFKYLNKGVMQQNSENSTSPSLKDLQFLADKESNNLDWYSQRLIDFLYQNKTLYPRYQQETQIDEIKPETTGYKTRLALGNSNKCNYKRWH